MNLISIILIFDQKVDLNGFLYRGGSLINFLSLILLLFIGLIIFRLLSLSFFLSLIYSVAIIITFIFLIMILDQSEILLRENYKFIPLGLYIMLGVTAYLAYSIWHVLSGSEWYFYQSSDLIIPLFSAERNNLLGGQMYIYFISSALYDITFRPTFIPTTILNLFRFLVPS